MATKNIAFTDAANHWRWVGNYWQEVQVGQLVTMPERGKIRQVKFKVAGLGPYYDPVYHNQQDQTRVAGAVWDASTGAIITKSAIQTLNPEDGGEATWKTFDLTDTYVDAGRKLIVGFWRIKTTTQWATQWEYSDAAGAAAETYVQMNSYSTFDDGPVKFVVSDRTEGKSLNYDLVYEAGGHVKVWSNGAWRVGRARVWNGSSWNEAVVKVYDGATWNESET
jgi:hypothetical protein